MSQTILTIVYIFFTFRSYSKTYTSTVLFVYIFFDWLYISVSFATDILRHQSCFWCTFLAVCILWLLYISMVLHVFPLYIYYIGIWYNYILLVHWFITLRLGLLCHSAVSVLVDISQPLTSGRKKKWQKPNEGHWITVQRTNEHDELDNKVSMVKYKSTTKFAHMKPLFCHPIWTWWLGT